MAKAKKNGSFFGNVLNIMGLVDEDAEAVRSTRNSRGSDDGEYSSASRSGYTPSSRRSDRNETGSRRSGSSRTSYRDRNGSSSGRTGRKTGYGYDEDGYTDWNSSSRASGKYSDDIYDADSTARSGRSRAKDDSRDNEDYYDSYETESYGYDEDYGKRQSGRRTTRNTKREENAEENRSKDSQVRRATSGASEVVVMAIEKVSDCKLVILSLLENKTVFISVDKLDDHMIQRVEDTLSGAVFALDAKFQQASNGSYVVAPNSITLNGANRKTERRF